MSPDQINELISHIDKLAEDDADHTSELLGFIEHSSPAVREAALWALWHGQLNAILEPVLHAADHDPDESVRATAVAVLGRFISEGLMLDPGQEDAVAGAVRRVREYLQRVLDNVSNPELIRRRALEALAFDADPALEETIEAWALSSNELLRKSAAFAMGRVDSEELTKHLIKALDDPSPMVRLEAIRSVGDRGLKKAVPRLIHLTEGKDEELACEAVQAMGQVGGVRAEAALKALQKKGGKLGAAAAEALEEM